MIFDIIKKSKFRLKKNKYKVLEKNIEKYRIEFEDFYHNANLKLKFFNLIDWKITFDHAKEELAFVFIQQKNYLFQYIS